MISREAWQKYRLALLVALIAALWLAGWATGISGHLDKQRVRAVVESAGAWGIVLFIAMFSLGELIHVPGLVFVAAAMLAYGKLGGAALSLAGALASVTVSFVVVRTVGGQPLAGIERPFVRRMLRRLDSKPIQSVALLRLVFWMAPFLNYALAMSAVDLRDYLLGSAIGLIVPVTVSALFFARLFG
jgi:uncharacterized membrane protein YdjX (TVP38/TMEM64 family)